MNTSNYMITRNIINYISSNDIKDMNDLIKHKQEIWFIGLCFNKKRHSNK